MVEGLPEKQMKDSYNTIDYKTILMDRIAIVIISSKSFPLDPGLSPDVFRRSANENP